MIGERLKQARSASGLSLRGLKGKIDNLVTAQAIGKYERNEAMPGSRVLIALARALDVSEDYLVGDREVVLEKVEFRKKSIASRKEEAQVEAKALHLLERYLLVEELLGLPSVDWDRPREAPYPVQALPEADRAARSLRQYWGLGIDPISNLVELLEERGIKVLVLDLAETIDGLTARARRVGREAAPVIVLNRRNAGERQRFTLAHELGHMTIQAGRGVDAEKAAHRFAGAFLMPVEALWAEIGKHRRQIGWGELFDLKRLFAVSVQAITYRCKDLGIFGEGLYRRLFREFSRRGWRSPPFPEPHPIAPETPKRFERLCFRALAEGAVSEAKAAELLGMSVRRLNELMEDPKAGPEGAETEPA
jgi:Zn-dependent peptidase ImmA (M78 family)